MRLNNNWNIWLYIDNLIDLKYYVSLFKCGHEDVLYVIISEHEVYAIDVFPFYTPLIKQGLQTEFVLFEDFGLLHGDSMAILGIDFAEPGWLLWKYNWVV